MRISKANISEKKSFILFTIENEGSQFTIEMTLIGDDAENSQDDIYEVTLEVHLASNTDELREYAEYMVNFSNFIKLVLEVTQDIEIESEHMDSGSHMHYFTLTYSQIKKLLKHHNI